MRQKTGGRQKGTPNKLTSRIKEEIGDIVNHTLMSIDIANLKPIEKIKLLQVLCQYIIPRLTTQHLDIEKQEAPREVQITIVDTDGNVKEKVKETTKSISMLDEKDLGLLHCMDCYFELKADGLHWQEIEEEEYYDEDYDEEW